MRRLLMVVSLFITLAGTRGGADTALAVKTLTEIKEATVFIRVEGNKEASSGTAFLIRTDGETGYLVTNHHVVHLTQLVERKVVQRVPPSSQPIRPAPLKPGTIPPIQIPSGPRWEIKTIMVEEMVPNPNISLVFHSGGKKEMTVKAEVVAAEPAADLAILKISKVKDLPKPIVLQPPELVETMSVFMFGFPFGKALGVDRGNPAITVTRGSIASIRTNKNDDIAVVQIDGEINPGNSGGPVVDEKGQLVGIAVAKIRGTKVALAIPAQELGKMLQGRLGEVKLTPVKGDKGELEVAVEVGVVDPMANIKSVSLVYVPSSAVNEQAKQQGLGSLSEAKKIDLQREPQRAVGKFTVTLPEKEALDLTAQAVFVDAAGKTVRGPLTSSALKAAAPPPPAVVAKPPVDPPVKPPVDPPVKPPVNPSVVNPPVVNPPEAFNAAALQDALKPAKPGDRGALVPPLAPAKRKALSADELAKIIGELQIADKARAAAQRLHNTEPNSKQRPAVAQLLESVAGKKELDVFVRRDAAKALACWGAEDNVPALAALAADSQIFVRREAIAALANVGGEKAAEAVLSRLEDFFDRKQVPNLVPGMGSAAEKPAVKLLDSTKEPVRLEACKMLKAIGTKESAPALFNLAEQDKSNSVRQAAQDALKTIAARQEKK